MAVQLLIELVDARQLAETNLSIVQRYLSSDVLFDDLLKVLRLELLARNYHALQTEILRGRRSLRLAG